MSRNKREGSFISELILGAIVIWIVFSILPILAVVLFTFLIVFLVISHSKRKKSKQNEVAIENDFAVAEVSIEQMSGRQFETFCADLLRKNNYYGVIETRASGDHGIDILANKDGIKYAIQCKCYSGNVGNKAIQEAYSGKSIYGADIAVVMVNTDFTKQAKEDAARLGVLLWNRQSIYGMISSQRNKGKTVHSAEFIEKYARECNAYLEHEDEMQSYKDYYK